MPLALKTITIITIILQKYSRHSVNGPSITGIIQLTDFYQSGNWMVELNIYGPLNHSVTGLLVRWLNGIQLMDHLAIGHISTIQLQDMSGNQMPTV